MDFILGVFTKEKDLDHLQTIICPSCGSYGRTEVSTRYTSLCIFLIPVSNWDRIYYIKTSCCNSLFTIDDKLGEAIERGEKIRLNESDLELLELKEVKDRVCSDCEYGINNEDFNYCPICGTALELPEVFPFQ